MIALSLCDRTGNMLKPWARAGFRCIAVDLQHEENHKADGIEYVHADIKHYLPPRAEYAVCFAFPPCTHFAVSGARWFKEKGLMPLAQSIELVEAARRIAIWTGARYMIENPVGTLSTYWRDPDYIFDPYEYGGYLNPPGDAYTKRTCLWTGGGFIMPPKNPVQPELGSMMHRLGPSEERANLRSVTPMGFAEAVFEFNQTKEMK